MSTRGSILILVLMDASPNLPHFPHSLFSMSRMSVLKNSRRQESIPTGSFYDTR